jgi:hypothetical protein
MTGGPIRGTVKYAVIIVICSFDPGIIQAVVKITLEQTTNAQRGSRGIDILFL